MYFGRLDPNDSPSNRHGRPRISRSFPPQERSDRLAGMQPCKPSPRPCLSCASYAPKTRLRIHEEGEGLPKEAGMSEPGPRRDRQTKPATKAQHERGEPPPSKIHTHTQPTPLVPPAFPTFSCPTNFRNCSKFPIASTTTASTAERSNHCQWPRKRRDPLTV